MFSEALRNKLGIGNDSERQRQIENIGIDFHRTKSEQKSLF